MRTGLEPAAPGVTGRYSNQLNYHTIFQCNAKLIEILILQNKYTKKTEAGPLLVRLSAQQWASLPQRETAVDNYAPDIR